MPGIWIVLVSVGAIALLVFLARLLDRARGIDPDDKWSNWYRGKSTSRSSPLWMSAPNSGSEYDSMDDHGNREQDGGLQ
jgi:hypothetical protein